MKRQLTTALDDRILTLRGVRVLLDADLAQLYGVSTKAFNQAIKRNTSRFPKDFRFQLKAKEFSVLRSQSVTSKERQEKRGGRQHLPWAYTQEGVAMLSGILQSPRAVAANIAIMRAFVRMRRALSERGDILARLETVEEELRTHTTATDKNLRLVFETLRRLLNDDSDTTAGRIGFRLQERKIKYQV
jgi:hypothetical protein